MNRVDYIFNCIEKGIIPDITPETNEEVNLMKLAAGIANGGGASSSGGSVYEYRMSIVHSGDYTVKTGYQNGEFTADCDAEYDSSKKLLTVSVPLKELNNLMIAVRTGTARIYIEWDDFDGEVKEQVCNMYILDDAQVYFKAYSGIGIVIE